MCFLHSNIYACEHQAKIEETICRQFDTSWFRCFGTGKEGYLETRLPYGCRKCRSASQKRERDEWRKGKKYYDNFSLGKE